jgi:biotin-dependent carboxylase-like uncharacterized protein
MTLIIERAGLTTVQDYGRPGWAHLGVPHSGAVDRGSFLLANRLAGNEHSAAMLETSGGLSLRASVAVTVVITGADTDAYVNDQPLAHCKATLVHPGDAIRINRMLDGMRCYVAFTGGVHGLAQLNSLSHDSLSEIVPMPLTAGGEITLGAADRLATSLDVPIVPRRSPRLRLHTGPHHSLLTPEQRHGLATQQWITAQDSNRIGIRLTSDALHRNEFPELLSLPLVRGAVQLTPSGELVVMLADHPTTGGYPVVGVLASDAVDDIAQRPSGTPVVLGW